MGHLMSGLTVVIPTRDRPKFLETCLKSVKAALDKNDVCVVVDSASRTDAVREVARAHNVTYIRADVAGASLARNLGWRHAKNEVIAFIDDDVVVDPKWGQSLKRTFAEFPEAAFVSGRIDRPEGAEGENFAPWMTYDSPAEIDGLSKDPGHSANLAVRRAALDAIGGFDELMGAGGRFRAAEDKDVYDRLFIAGRSGRYDPDATVIHDDWRERRHAFGLHWNYGIGSGARMAKLIKLDPDRARRVARETLWEWGFHDIYRAVRHLNVFLITVNTLRTTAMLIGLARALPYRVLNGHLVPPWRSRGAAGQPR